VVRPEISRRGLLLSAAAALACGRRKASPFPGFCFVANQQGRSVAAVDLTRFRVRKQIPLDAEPAAVLPHPTRSRVFVLAPAPGTVYEIDSGSLAVSRRARAGNLAVGMQLSPSKNALWVLYRDPAALVEFPLDSLRPGRRIRLPAPPDGFDVGVPNQAAIAMCHNGTVAMASLSRAAIEQTIEVGAEPSLVRFQWDGKQLIAASAAERLLTIFNVASGKVVVRLPLPLQPRHLCFNGDGGQLFVSGVGIDAIAIVFPHTTEVDQTVLAGHAPGAMAVTGLSPFRYLLVANPESNNLTVLNIDTRKLVAVVQVGRHPNYIVVTPDKEYALVLNEQSGDLAVIRILSLATAPNGSLRRYKSAPLFTLIPVGERPVSAAVIAIA
jgi:YVTN family beta-propeller protein